MLLPRTGRSGGRPPSRWINDIWIKESGGRWIKAAQGCSSWHSMGGDLCPAEDFYTMMIRLDELEIFIQDMPVLTEL